ncbi:sensor histidine kinase GraS [Clostridium tepidiprofundi DSM 19306]|uniref:histidine kinase n=1 Tax=Clostridium tepidiprofundi DSM 19306 TaxID=1121338 RepID=A0A151B6J4_9CLOT|nr:sensor histidine kinase [Clostridium tepidiprofundi]KYH35267.1 sensor histidine kinase GraS [Clostridium tepidiprofundi DSM 19306]
MKSRDWLNILSESHPWILLLCINDVFFIFMAWLAYPKTFGLLVGIMIIFSVTSIVFGMLFISKNKEKQSKVFYDFLRDPSTEHECRLIESMGNLYKEEVKYLANKLRMQNDQLNDAKLQSLNYEEFIESWVHEIKTPISLATFVLENRKEEMSKLVYQRLEHARIDISDNVERILFYARLQASHVDYRLERVSLNLCCEDVLLELEALLEENEVKVISHMEDVPIVSDKKALQFIFTQIFVNSVKYSNKEIQSFIWLKTGLDSVKKRYYLRISDNGIGVLASDLPFIFDKGFTGDNSERSKSTGIGLYLVKKLCDELQIEIEVESEYGKNFVIQLLFPIVEEV